jgi:hypothetical protein
MDCDRWRGFHRDCIQPVRDRPIQQRRNRFVSHSAIERKICVLVTLTVDLYRTLRALIAYKNTEAQPDPACQQLCD